MENSQDPRLGEHYNRYQRNNTNSFNDISYEQNDYSNVFAKDFNKQLSISQEPDIMYQNQESYLTVSSKDRDMNTYPSSSQFVIHLDKEYRNIKSIELIQAIIPDKNSVTSEPFLLLNILELENVMDSNNKQISESFAILQVCPPTIPNSFLQIDKRIFENVILNYRTPKASLSKMSFSITDCDGKLFNFGGNSTTDKAYQTTFVFKVTTLDTNRKSIGQRNVY